MITKEFEPASEAKKKGVRKGTRWSWHWMMAEKVNAAETESVTSREEAGSEKRTL